MKPLTQRQKEILGLVLTALMCVCSIGAGLLINGYPIGVPMVLLGGIGYGWIDHTLLDARNQC